VVKGKRKKAVGIKYDPARDDAPKVKAKGAGYLADRILNLARKHGVPIKQDNELVETLYALDIDQEIPPELYRAVAEVLAFIYRLSAQLKESTTIASRR